MTGPTGFGPEAFQVETGAPDAAMADLEAYRALLVEWSGRMNLVGPSALEEFWLRHAFDSAQLLALEPEARRWADLGAGAGLPGVVLAILLKHGHGGEVALVDSLAKRCRFLTAVVEALDLPAVVHNERAESLRIPPVDVVTARACAPMIRLLGYAEPCLKGRAVGLFLKGRGVETELDEARRRWRFSERLIASRSGTEGRIVRVERLTRA